MRRAAKWPLTLATNRAVALTRSSDSRRARKMRLSHRVHLVLTTALMRSRLCFTVSMATCGRSLTLRCSVVTWACTASCPRSPSHHRKRQRLRRRAPQRQERAISSRCSRFRQPRGAAGRGPLRSTSVGGVASGGVGRAPLRVAGDGNLGLGVTAPCYALLARPTARAPAAAAAGLYRYVPEGGIPSSRSYCSGEYAVYIWAWAMACGETVQARPRESLVTGGVAVTERV